MPKVTQLENNKARVRCTCCSDIPFPSAAASFSSDRIRKTPLSRVSLVSRRLGRWAFSHGFLSLPQCCQKGVQGRLALSHRRILKLLRTQVLLLGVPLAIFLGSGSWTQKSSMAPYHIRMYRESDRQRVVDLFSQGMIEHVPSTFRHILKLPRTQVLLLGVPLAIFLGSGSWALALMAGLTLLAALRLLAKFPWTQYVNKCMDTDMSDITKTYLSERGSCFWVAESEGQVVGMVGALPAEEPTLRKKQVELFHLSVATKCRGQGIAKALIRTLLQFARDQGYSEVVLVTTTLVSSTVALYESMGFQKRHLFFPDWSWALIAVRQLQLIYRLPSAQVFQVLQERGNL